MAWFVKTETFTAVGFQMKLQQAAVYAAVTWWMATGVRAAVGC